MIISEQYFIADPTLAGRIGNDEWGTVTNA